MSWVGLDVGGTKIAAARLGEQGVTVATDTGSEEALVAQLLGLIEAVRDEHTRAVGIGVPSVVEFATGRIRASVNIPLANLPLRALLSERVGLPVYVDNDANCAALAEAHSAGTRHLVMLTIGTGVGGGVIIDGRIFRGATGAAPELGHQIVGMDLERGTPEAARFPQPGSLESLAAGRALDRLAQAAGLADGPAAVAAAQAGDAGAREAIRLLAGRVGIGIANAINVFDPEEVVIGGGVSAAGDLLLEPAERVAWQYVVPGVGTSTSIRLARHGNEAGVIGAALLAAQESDPV